MKSALTVLLFVAAAAGLLLLGGLQELPADHPPVLPAGHPPMERPPTELTPFSTAEPQDVSSPEAIMSAYYEAVSGPAGTERDWDRFRSLFSPDAQLVTARPGSPAGAPVKLNADQFIAANRTYFENGGYFERQIHGRIDTFGRIAQVFSTYESRRGRADTPPYSRGINSIQLMHNNDRWWIVSVIWDRERGGGERIPSEYLPPEE